MVLLEDDLEDAILLREAGRYIVKYVRQLHYKLMRRVQDLTLQVQSILSFLQFCLEHLQEVFRYTEGITEASVRLAAD